MYSVGRAETSLAQARQNSQAFTSNKLSNQAYLLSFFESDVAIVFKA